MMREEPASMRMNERAVTKRAASLYEKDMYDISL